MIWVVLVTILAQTVTYTLNGRLSDIFGRRWFFISGAFLSFVGFIVSGTAHSLLVIIGGVSTSFSIKLKPGVLFPNLQGRTPFPALAWAYCNQNLPCLGN